MQIKNTQNKYGITTILFHWIMAVIIIGLLGFGIYMTRLSISLTKLKMYGWHKEFGMLVLGLVILRILWRFINITPRLPDTLTKFEKFSARSVHWLFYLFMFAMPITGWLITSAAGLPVSFFGLFLIPNLIETNEPLRILFQVIHQWLGYALIGVICLHISAALKHHFINRDDVLRRIV